MRLTPIKDIEEDMVLGKSIYQIDGKLLIGAGMRIDPQIKEKLLERGYTHVYIMEEGTEEVVPEQVISDEVSFEAKSRLAKTIYDIQDRAEFTSSSVSKAKHLIAEGYLKDAIITYDIKKIVEEILSDITSTGAKVMNSVMIKTADSFFLDHALNVTVLSLLLGLKYHFSTKENLSLGLGTFLHDIGKIVIEMLNEKEDPKITKELYPEHPTFGYNLLNNSPDISPLETQIVKQHHERQDGKGFPIGLMGENLPPVKTVTRSCKGYIFRLAEICSVANAFDNLVFNPFDQRQNTPDNAIKQIIIDAGTKYNKDIVQMLLKVVPHYPVGVAIKVVNIADLDLIGSSGVVAKINKDNINKPVIIINKNKFMKPIKPIVIDTSQIPRVELELLI